MCTRGLRAVENHTARTELAQDQKLGEKLEMVTIGQKQETKIH